MFKQLSKIAVTAMLALSIIGASITVSMAAASATNISSLLKDTKAWKAFPASALSVKSGVLTLSAKNGETNMAATTESASLFNKTIEFSLKTPLNPGDTWSGFALRTAIPGEKPWNMKDGKFTNSCYFILFLKDNIHLQIFKKGETDADFQKSLLVIPNKSIIKSGVKHKIQVGAINEGKGVRITLKVDGKTIINKLDNTNPILKKGSFEFITQNQSTEITR